MKWISKAAIALAAAGTLASGCAGDNSPTSANAQSIQLAALPNVPGCGEIRAVIGGDISAKPIAGVDDLYVVFSNDTAVCIDSREGIEARFGATCSFAASNPMPGEGQRAYSNPMPGNPGDPCSSNPMPGIDPLNSNPMPGSDRRGN
jgi:hypothetical protein